MGVQPPSSVSDPCHPPGVTAQGICHLQEGALSVAAAAAVALLQCWWLFCAGSGGGQGLCGGWNFSRSFQEQDTPGSILHCPPALSQPSTGWRCARGWMDGEAWPRRSTALLRELPPVSVWAAMGNEKSTQKWCKSSKSCSRVCSTAPAPVPPSHLSKAGFGCCGAEPPQDLPSEPVGVTKAGLGTCAGSRWKGWAGRDLKAPLVPIPFHQPTLLQGQNSSTFLIPCWQFLV